MQIAEAVADGTIWEQGKGRGQVSDLICPGDCRERSKRSPAWRIQVK
jgi:hypothetical protein